VWPLRAGLTAEGRRQTHGSLQVAGGGVGVGEGVGVKRVGGHGTTRGGVGRDQRIDGGRGRHLAAEHDVLARHDGGVVAAEVEVKTECGRGIALREGRVGEERRAGPIQQRRRREQVTHVQLVLVMLHGGLLLLLVEHQVVRGAAHGRRRNRSEHVIDVGGGQHRDASFRARLQLILSLRGQLRQLLGASVAPSVLLISGGGAVMLLNVFLEFVAPTRRVVAVFALEGFLGQMYALVSHQVALLDERSVANLASVRAYGEMSTQMGGQLTLLGRRVIALVELTMEYVARVDALVRYQMTLVLGREVALITAKRPASALTHLVHTTNNRVRLYS
jgi:hypothetical protein